MKSTLLTLMLVAIGTIRCMHDPIIPAEPLISFSHQILPIIISYSTTEGYHGGSSGEEEISRLTSYKQARDHVSPGNAKEASFTIA